MNVRLGVFLAVCSSVIYGVFPAASRAVYADGGNSVFMILLTTWARALSLGLFCLLIHKPLFHTRIASRQAFTGGFFQAISILTIFAALSYLPGPVVIIILFTHTLMLLFFLAWRRKIKLDTVTVLTTLAALCGLTIVLDIWHPQNLSFLGLGLAFAAAIATMSRFYVYGELTKTRHPAVVGAEAFLMAGAFVLFLPLFAPARLPHTPVGGVWALLCSLAMVAGSFCTFYGMSFIGSFKFSLLAKIEPVFTSLFSVLLIDEVLAWHQYLGMIVVIGSLVVYQFVTPKLSGSVPLARAEAGL